jgi:hypothetical protein
MDLTICFVFRQQKAVADAIQCNGDDDKGNYYLVLFSEGEARRSLRSELNTVREISPCAHGKCNKHGAPTTIGISTWNLSEQDSMLARYSTERVLLFEYDKIGAQIKSDSSSSFRAHR